MVISEQFECRIPEESAIKQDVIYCTGTAPDNYLVMGDVATWVTAIATVLLVVGAFWAGTVAVNTLKQMKKDSLDRSRPYIFASLVPSLAGGHKYDLLIENSGESAARRVKFRFLDAPNEPDDIAEMLLALEGIEHTMPPKTRIRRYWRLELAKGHTWSTGGDDPAGMPTKGNIEISYSDNEGRRFKDHYSLDIASIGGSPMPEEGPNVKDELSNEQKDQHKMLAVIARSIGELRR